MSVLVTGGAGFIGSHLIERLLVEWPTEQIVCLDNFNDYYDPALKRANVAAFANEPRVVVIEGDFRDADCMARLFDQRRVTHVVHLGAYAGVRVSLIKPLMYAETNVLGTLALLEAARRHAVERFVFASSSTVYGAGATAPFVEDAILGTPLSPYGASKRAGELLCFTYHELYRVPVVCLRLFSVYGPRLRPDLAMTIFTTAILSGAALPLNGDGSIRRDFTHVRDICGGVMAALDRPLAVNQAINLGHDEPVAVRDVIRLIEKASARTARIESRPPQQGDMPVTHADLTKARRLLDYRPTIPFEEGVAEYVVWRKAMLAR